MSSQYSAALIRGLIGGAITALASFGTLYGAGANQRLIISGVIAAFVGVMVSRGLVEGTYDTSRANNGDVKPSDVGQGGSGTTTTPSTPTPSPVVAPVTSDTPSSVIPPVTPQSPVQGTTARSEGILRPSKD